MVFMLMVGARLKRSSSENRDELPARNELGNFLKGVGEVVVVIDAANDNVTVAQVDSSATAYAGNQSGLNVPVSGTRGLWFRLDMPTSSSVTTQRSFTVEIEAQ